MLIGETCFRNESLKMHLKDVNRENKFWKRKDKVITGIIRNEMNMKNRHSAWERYFDFYRPIVPCPKSANVILVTGQSNSSNSVHSKKYENKLHVNYFNGSCFALDNPVFGADDNKGSVVPAIASKLVSKTPYIFLATGWGGTSIKDWDEDKTILSNYTNNALKDLEKKEHNLSAVVWIQGESDSIFTTGQEIDYISYFNKMKSNILQGLNNKQNIKFVITQSTRCFRNPRDKN